MRTAILIPCFNEAPTIGKVVDDFSSTMPHAEIFVYDNNSTDGTADIAREHGATVKHEPRQGKGNVVRSMFRDIDADCYILVDGDDTYPASIGPVFEQLIYEEHVDMAVGDRLSSTYFSENTRRFHGFGNRLVRRLINSLFNAEMHDIMSGARAFSRNFVKMFAVLSRGFELETEMAVFALEHNLMVTEVPIGYRDRPHGSTSKLNTIPDGIRVLLTIARLFRDVRPLAFFTTLSTVLLLVSAAMFVPILTDFIATGIVRRFPTLIILAAIFTASTVCYFSGVVLSAMKRKHLESFERELNMLVLNSSDRNGGDRG